jgi:4-amino-4-deoxy-L-arabinose transferase-like glycosyltransferase
MALQVCSPNARFEPHKDHFFLLKLFLSSAQSRRQFAYMTKENVRSVGPFLLLLILFVIAKWPHLHYPFFWDESWSYAPGVRLMYNHGPSLMPDAIDTFYSRGHPLFFYAAASAWMHLTGGYSHFNAHLFALFVTVCLLVTVYTFTRKFAGGAAALVAVASLMVHVGFFVQATSVMPEMMVALFSLLSVSAFADRKYGLAGIGLTLLLFTKESSIVAGFVLGIAALATLFNRELSRREKIYALLSAALPAAAIGSFFLLQKHLLGWYLYPEHTGLISFEWNSFFAKFRESLSYLLASEVPRFLMYAGCLAVIAYSLRYRSFKPVLPLIPLGIAYLMGRQKIDFIPSNYQFALLTVVLAGTLTVYLWKSTPYPTRSGGWCSSPVSATSICAFAA